MEAKDIEIALLKAQLLAATTNGSSENSVTVILPHRVEWDALSRPVSTRKILDSPLVSHSIINEPAIQMCTTYTRRGKAPPIEPFVGEGADMLFEEWLPSFERVATWNSWGETKKIIQLGHLRGKTL